MVLDMSCNNHVSKLLRHLNQSLFKACNFCVLTHSCHSTLPRVEPLHRGSENQPTNQSTKQDVSCEYKECVQITHLPRHSVFWQEEYEEAANNALADPVCSDHSSEVRLESSPWGLN